jgi:2,4-dienoyl-CoA reductase-like NADH-dependent reductase (Old Yellow Enzyme family)
MTEVYKKLFSPMKLAGQTIPNRIAMAPLTRQMAEADGTPTDEMAAYYARRARGGFGLIITEGTYEEDKLGCRAYLSQPGIANKKHVKGWKKSAKAIHDNGAKGILQLMHGGRVSDPRVLGGKAPVSASATQSGGWTLYTDSDYERQIRDIKNKTWPKVTFGKARALTVKELGIVADGFADGAARAVEAGFDGVEIHGANGYLLWQFINPKTNLREDEFGGSPENNVRFARMVCERVRKAIGKDKIITLRVSQDGVDDFVGAWPGGVNYARAIGKALKGAHIDAIHWSSFGWRDNRDPNNKTPMSEVIRKASGIPVITNGGHFGTEHRHGLAA